MKRLAVAALITLLVFTIPFGVGCCYAPQSGPETPVVEWLPTIAPGRDSTGYYTEAGMLFFVRPDETRELAKEFRSFAAEDDFKIDWGEPQTYVLLCHFLNGKDFKYQKDLKRFVQKKPVWVLLHTMPGDHWKTPAETIKDGGGDCEDLSVLIISLMRELGCPNEMRLVLGKVENHEGPGLHLWTSVTMPHAEELIIEGGNYRVYYDYEGRTFEGGRVYRGTILRTAFIPPH